MAGGFSLGGPVPPSGGGFAFGAAAPAPPSFATGAATTTNNGVAPTSSSSSPPSVRALAWDPTGPASLTLCPLSQDGVGGKGDQEESIDLDVFLSHDGTGCPSPEAECLLRCLDARDEWLGVQTRQGGGRRRVDGGSGGGCVTNLSMDFRAALCECLMRLQSQAEGDVQMKEGEGEEGNNLELLSVTYALSHLAEIFLLPSPASTNTSTYPSTMMDGGFHDTASGGRRLDGPPGSLTADAVRYLRLHHTSASSLLDIPAVVEMLDHDQPEYYQPSTSTSIAGPYDRPYWNLLLKLVLTGRLADAWAVLSRHAACRRAEEAARDAGALSPEGEGFSALRALFLAAPLPGGRGDGYCDDAGLDDYLEEETLELDGIGEDEEEKAEEEDAVDPGDIDEPLIDGLGSGSYLLWESRPRHADKLRTLRYRRDLRKCGRADEAVELGSAESPTVPEMYQPRVALNAFQLWQDMVRTTAFPAGVEGRDHGALTALFGRFPPLKQICSLLLGSIPRAIAEDPSVTWSESLLAELLYRRPDIRPEDVAARANVAMTKAGGGKRALEQIVLGIMGGSAGQVIETMFSLCGGASGAALPAAMTSLLCNLLVDAGCMPAQKDASAVHIPTELLLLTAESILSSFSVQAQSDVGVRTAVRLLLPHAPPRRGTADGDGVVVYEPRLAAAIAEALSHRLPATDAEARDLLQLCEGAVRRGSVPLADACESLAFGRASVHRTTGDLAREVHWLLRGMDVQSSWLPADRRRKLGFASRRHFDALCERTAHRLVCRLSRAAIVGVSESRRAMDEQEREVASAIRAAEDVLEGVLQAEDAAPVLRGHIEANLLEQAVDIAMADAEGDTARVAAGIVQCLEERCLSEGYGGVVSTLSDPKLYVEFLNIAFAILAKEEAAAQGKPMELATCAFTVHGMHILMARLTQVLSWEGIICSDGSSLSKQPTDEKKEYFNSIRQALCKGLMRAFVENKQSALAKTTGSKEEGGQLSPDEEIELMLSPCI